MRPVELTRLSTGINRQRVKGSAAPTQLYDLVNAYINSDGSVIPREGTFRAETLDGNSKGLMATDGLFNIFGNTLAGTVVPAGYVFSALIDPNDATQQIEKIWFAKPFLGFPYVVAQFANGDVFHYWLQNGGTWAANTVYFTSTLILPTTLTGLAYQATRISQPNPLWTPETTIAVNTIVEPNDYTGFMYKAIAVEGSAPHTSQVEPTWPTTAGSTIQEFGDFDTSATDAGTTQPSSNTPSAQLSPTLTDRYGDSGTIANGGIPPATGLVLPTTANETVTTWAAGTNYAPGAVVQPSTAQGAFLNAIPNGDFENGNDGSWTFSGTSLWGYSSTGPYQGNECIAYPTGGGTAAGGDYARMTSYATITPGASVTATGYLNPNNSGSDLELWLCIDWYNSSDTLISEVLSAPQEGGGYRLTTVTGIAPAGAAHVRVAVRAGSGTTHRNVGFADLISWNLETPAAISNFLYEAVQAAAAPSGSTEPTWPTTAGQTVVDGGVTWEAIGTSIITWEAIPIMQSGATEPTFPIGVGLSVLDPSTYTDKNGVVIPTSISWVAASRQITDTKCPNSIAVALAASHVFAGDNDIVPFSAAVDPTDWTTADNAGYLPSGTNNYGDNPVAVLALYRSNLMVFNAGGYQMWQMDPDPANMALLDAQPVGSIWPQAAQSVANDILFLTEVGVRNIGTAGANANLQIGNLGQPVDVLVKAALQAGTYKPISLYYPGRGQYWLIFGPQAFVLTVNGTGLKTWSRYIFPDSITDWCLNGGVLYLRTAGNLVWQFSDQTLADDASQPGTFDPSFSLVKLLLHFDGANGSTSIIDSSSNAYTMIAASPMALETSNVLFGTASGSFNPSNPNNETAGVLSPTLAASTLDPGTGDFTFELWFWTTAFSNDLAGINTQAFDSCGFGMTLGGGQILVYGWFDDTGTFHSRFIGGVVSGAWNHVALERSGGNMTLYLNGVNSGFSDPYSGNFNLASFHATAQVVIGESVPGAGRLFSGYIDEFRYTVGLARYTSNFTPAGPFPSVGPTGVNFESWQQWPYLDLSNYGASKFCIGVDLTANGSVSIQLAYREDDVTTFIDNPGFDTSQNVTAPYTVALADTVPGDPIPIPVTAPSISLVLVWTPGVPWSWQATNIYLADNKYAGSFN